MKSNRNFIRKWGNRSNAPKFNIAFRIKNCTFQLLELLEPWCDRVYSDTDWMKYIVLEQPNTKFDLRKRCQSLTETDRYDYDDVVIEIDGTRFIQQDFDYIQRMCEILNDVNETGQYELGNLQIAVNFIKTYEHDLVKVKL